MFPSQSPSLLYLSLTPLPHLLQGLEQSPLSIEQGADLGSVLQESQLLSSVQNRVPLSSGSMFPRDILLFFKKPYEIATVLPLLGHTESPIDVIHLGFWGPLFYTKGVMFLPKGTSRLSTNSSPFLKGSLCVFLLGCDPK